MYKFTNLHQEYLEYKSLGYKLLGYNYITTGGYILFKAKEL